MRIYDRAIPESSIDSLNDRVKSDLHHALNAIATIEGRFVVNDTLWFIKRGTGKITPCVMNKANFISKRFQDSLRDDRGWEKEKTLAGQTIDNYLEIKTSGSRYRLPPDTSFLEFFQEHCKEAVPADLRKEFLAMWHQYVKLGLGHLSSIDASKHGLFEKVDVNDRLKIGLEFETGNIASAFRSLDKLESLFVGDHIDFGVFVTSINKANAAARIWPQSNRNGSFAELENRNYHNNLTVPLWEFGFEPDEFKQDAAYFNGTTLYFPRVTGRTETGEDGIEYEVYLREDEEILKPVTRL